MLAQASAMDWAKRPGAASARKPSPHPNAFVGSRACATCHAPEYNSWLGTPHAQAASVGCEACHGPGGLHRRRPVSTTIQREPGSQHCLSCHTHKASPEFRRIYPDKKREVHPDRRQLNTLWTEVLTGALGSGRPIEMELFVMSDCPYGIDAERRIVSLAMEFPEQLQLRVTFMPDAQLLAATDEGETSPGCLPESGRPFSQELSEPTEQDVLEEQLRQVLIREYVPERFLDYVLSRLELPPEVPWEEAAASVGLATDLVEELLQVGQGMHLLRQDAQRSRALGIYASPTLLVEDRLYPGTLTSVAFYRQWCAAVGAEHPFCQRLPKCASDVDCDLPREFCADAGSAEARCVKRPEVPVTLTVLDSLQCRSCFSDLIIASVNQLFASPTVRWLDVGSRQGRRLARRHGLDRLPAYLFSPSIEECTTVFAELQPVLKQTSDGYLVVPELLEAPLLWPRKRRTGQVELWFHPGEAASDLAEAGWAKWLSLGERSVKPEIHYVIEDPTAFLRPHFSLAPVPGSDSLALSPRLTRQQLDLLYRRTLWQLAPEALEDYLRRGNRLPEDFKPPERWVDTFATVSPQALRSDIRRRSELPFIDAGGGALVHNQVWLSGWEAGTIPRVFYELGETIRAEGKEN